MIGLDTCAIIDLFRKDLKIIELIESLDEELCSTIINYQEIMFGMDLKDSKYHEEEKFYDDFFTQIFLYLLDTASSKESSRIFWDLKRRGNLIEEMDCSIAGILLTNGVKKIITRNAKHFEKIPGIEVVFY